MSMFYRFRCNRLNLISILKTISVCLCFFSPQVSSLSLHLSSSSKGTKRITGIPLAHRVPRSNFLKGVAFLSAGLAAGSPLYYSPPTAFAFSPSSPANSRMGNNVSSSITATSSSQLSASADSSNVSTVQQQSVAYRSMSANMPQFGVNVPVAIWFPTNVSGGGGSSKKSQTVYNHRISVKKIGTLLAGWGFLPELLSRDFQLNPTSSGIVDGFSVNLPTSGPVVLLAHGYLGSRFDLSHIAERLAGEGFICVSPEYPESLASSYPSVEGLNRKVITDRVLEIIKTDMKIEATSFGIVGHSLGCGTALTTGDSSWTRVTIAGPAKRREGEPECISNGILSILSTNDGLSSRDRIDAMLPATSGFIRLNESRLIEDYMITSSSSSNNNNKKPFPQKAALVFDRVDAPNHISFLSSTTNDSMINLLSPLLPVAQALEIPVLDFDKYKDSRDSQATANVVIPLIVSYLKQYMA